MIKKIKNWARKSEHNSLAFTAYSIIAVQLMWFIPYITISVNKYGWSGKMPQSDSFILAGAILLSMWIGFKFSMKFLYK